VKTILLSVILIIALFNNSSFCQNRINFGTPPYDKTVNKNNSLNNGDANKAYPAGCLGDVDFSIDNEEDIFLLNSIAGIIQKFDKNGVLLSEIKLPVEYTTHKVVRTYKICNDSSGYLYLLILEFQNFKYLVKYNKEGEEVFKITRAELKFDKARNIKNFFINNNDNICFNTMPVDLVAPDNGEGHWFLYNTNGKFIKRTYFPFTIANRYFAYKTYGKNNYIEYFPKQGGNTNVKDKDTTFIEESSQSDAEGIIGCDKSNKIYILNITKIIIFDVNNKSQNYVPLNNHDYSTFGDYISRRRYIKVSRNGKLYQLGIVGKEKEINGSEMYNCDELNLILAKLN